MVDTFTADDDYRGRLYPGIIIAASVVIAVITYGIVFSFGVFVTPLREYFGTTSAVISGVYALSMLAFSGSGIVAGWSVDKYGPRITTLIGGLLFGLSLLLTSQVRTIGQLYMTYSMVGIAISTAHAPLMTTVSRWFTRRRGLALGILTAGIGGGPLIIAPLSAYLIHTVGWRFAYLVLAGGAGIILLMALLLKKSPENTDETRDVAGDNGRASLSGKKTGEFNSGLSDHYSPREAIGTRSFWQIGIIFLVIGMSAQMVKMHVVPYSESQGMSPLLAATVLSVLSGASVVGRITMGMASDAIGRRQALAICVFTEGAMMLWLIGASNVWMFFLFGIIYGYSYGGHGPQLPALAGETLGLKHMGTILGSLNFFWGLGAAVGPVLAGYLLDATGSYSSAFILGAMGMLLATAVSLLPKKPVGKQAV